MVNVHVDFTYRGQDWSHDFNVMKGSTILKLKELMLQSNGNKKDTDSFELQQEGRRIPDFEPIWKDMRVNFTFVGPEEGTKKAAKDEDLSRKAAKEERAQLKPVEQVEVTIKHAMEEMQSEITLKVASNGTILDVRKAVMAALGESKLSEVKLIKRSGTALTTLINESEIGDRREFLSMGRRLQVNGVEPQAQAKAAPTITEVKLKITSTSDQATKEIELPAAKTVFDLKLKICEQVQRGTASQLKLLVTGKEIKDSDKLGSIPENSWSNLKLEGIDLGPPRNVEVTVVHATSGRQAQVSMLDTGTMLDLKRAISALLKATMADIRIVKKLAGGGSGWQSLPDSERLNGRIEVHCYCKELEEQVFEDKDLNITITLDRTLELSHELTVKKGCTLLSIKNMLAEGDPTGSTKPEDFGLCLASATGKALPNDLRITEEHVDLEIIQ